MARLAREKSNSGIYHVMIIRQISRVTGVSKGIIEKI